MRVDARARHEKALREQDALKAKQYAIGHFLRSEGGRDLVAYLARRFADGPLVGMTVEKTYFNLGRREVVEHLREMQALPEQERSVTA